MHLERLTLTNVRTFRRLDLGLAPGSYVVTGPNAAGKTNLLEAIALLATTRSSRAGADVELISQLALREEPLPAATLHADVVTAVEPVSVGRFRVDGIARRASELIGRLRVVMFSADDLHILEGSPARRRRYLDITISQLDRVYLRALQRYQRVLQQRNSLLRNLQERRGRPDELDFWDQELAAAGAVVLHGRASALRALGRGAAAHYEALAPLVEPLEVCYEPALPGPAAATVLDASGVERVEEALRETLEARRRDDLAAGMTRSGPHRDDVRFAIGGNDAGAYASRGQQRTAALALRLAEVALSLERTGDAPLLLLDDILSELDAQRRERVLAAAYGVDQVVITSPDEDRPTRDELPEAQRYRLEGGELLPAG
jgi:DNA replication and repair protein RecF